MIKCLELFSGTKSVGKVCDQLGWESVSVDLIMDADHKCDIMDFDYKQYDKDEFDIIWASPPCTNYSALKKCWYGRKLKNGIVYTKELNEIDQNEADKLVLKTLEIINYFNCEYWFMENPQTGNLKNREIMKGIPFYDVDYCMYSDWGYKKRTRIWTNKKDWENKLCDNSGSCGNMIQIDKRHLHQTNCGNTEKIQAVRKHLKSIGIGADAIAKGQKSVAGGGTNRLERYRIPEDLIFSLFLD
tara:strand:- start:5 stop:733 length:729 start_codon:yes stop_codon:yes gene_type:complete